MTDMVTSATRMELSRLKDKLSTTSRGYHLLKDKQDELIRQFMAFTNDYKNALKKFKEESMLFMGSYKEIQIRHFKKELSLHLRNIFNQKVVFNTEESLGLCFPSIKLETSNNIINYSLFNSDASLDTGIKRLSNYLNSLLEFATFYKTLRILLSEINKVKRRVNAIEHLIIPELEAAIKKIRAKLADIELSNAIRTIKSKEIIEAKDKK